MMANLPVGIDRLTGVYLCVFFDSITIGKIIKKHLNNEKM